MTPPDPDDVVPNASSPQLLLRLLELVGQGVRAPRSLEESLGVDPRTVRYYIRAGEWLGLLVPGDRPTLTPLGLELCYAGPQRGRVYAAAAWSVPLVRDVMAGHRDLPGLDEVADAIRRSHPELAEATVRRRASSVRSLVMPALTHRGALPRRDAQVELPLARPSRSLAPPSRPETSSERDPGLLRYLLGALVDYGELTLGNLRALLDRSGASGAPIGTYVEHLLARGDAARDGDRLIVTRECARQHELLESTPSVILSDPGYRRWLDDLRLGTAEAEARRRSASHRWAPWDRRLFGATIRADELDAALGRVLLERGLSSWPTRGAPGAPLGSVSGPFLEHLGAIGLPIALPPSLEGLRGGLAAFNAALARVRPGVERVDVPSMADSPARVHGGALSPGERPPRAVPDARSLRLRLIRHAPYVAMMTALLIAHRRDPRLKLVSGDDGPHVVLRSLRLGRALDVLDDFALDRGWVPSRRTRGGLGGAEFVATLEAVGIALTVGKSVVLDEGLFRALREEPEEGELAAQIEPLVVAVSDHVVSLAEATPKDPPVPT
jgi:hypothetical protein